MATRTFPTGAVLLALIVLALLLHAPVMGLSFFSDDFSVIHRIGVQGDLGTGSFFRPLPDWTLYLNFLVAGPTPWAFRIVNVALLGLNAWLVFMLCRRLAPAGAKEPYVAALLFICYPFHIEPQLWIIGRSTAMATTFTLLALVLAAGEARTTTKCMLVGLCTALGTLCYEPALLIPLLLGAMALLHRDRKAWRSVVLSATAVVVANLILRSLLTGHVANEYGAGFFKDDVLGYATSAVKVFARLFLPPHPDADVQMVRFGLLAPLLLLGAGILLWRERNDGQFRREFFVLLVMVLVACSIGIVGGVSTRTSESDRFLYMPSAFLCILLTLTFRRIGTGALWRVAFYSLFIPCSILLKQGLANWRVASDTIERIIDTTPNPQDNGRLLVWNLPSDHEGAFLFRHGYREALEFNGRDASRIRIVPEGPNSIWEFLRTETGDTLHRNDHDVWFDANGALKRSP